METNTLEREAMKFVINGRSFDTATATKVAIDRGIDHPNYSGMVGDSELRYENVLYRTAKGAFFIHQHHTEKLVKGGRPVVTDFAYELSREEASKWVSDRRAMILDGSGLDLPEEA